MKVPFLDLKAQYESLKDEIRIAIQNVLDSCSFAGGPFVEGFEKEFAAYCHCNYAIGVGSGTEALWLSLLALGIGPGDEVVTVPNTFIATVEAISFCGAKPAFVDVDERTCTMDPLRLEDYLRSRFSHNGSPLTARPKAVIPVHLFGQTADMDPIIEIAERYGLYVIEDSCQAHGAEYRGRRAGSLGDLGCFSFYPGKNLGAYGDAGAVTTNDQSLWEKIRILRDHGQPKKYQHDKIGWNARMDGIQGSILGVKLKRLDQWNESRRKNAELYNILLAESEEIFVPTAAEYAKHVYHIYAIRSLDRDDLLARLKKKNIHCGIHYPVPIHLTAAYQDLGWGKGEFPTAETAADQLISLPMFPELTEDQIWFVTDAVKEG